MGPKKTDQSRDWPIQEGVMSCSFFLFFRFNSHGQVRSLYIPVMTSQKRLIVGWNLHEYTN